MSKIIEKLKTQRNTWSDAELFESVSEARAAGFSLMYEDEEGVVFGINNPDDIYTWDRIGFVPYRGYYPDYFKAAKETEPSLDEHDMDEHDTVPVPKEIDHVKVTVSGGEISEKEVKAYIDRKRNMDNGINPLKGINISVVDDDHVDIEYDYGKEPFQRIRRVTGYLAGTVDRFNNAKKAEVKDRVTHEMPQQNLEDVYVDGEETEASETSEESEEDEAPVFVQSM